MNEMQGTALLHKEGKFGGPKFEMNLQAEFGRKC
jgi:hypothetical protein